MRAWPFLLPLPLVAVATLTGCGRPEAQPADAVGAMPAIRIRAERLISGAAGGGGWIFAGRVKAREEVTLSATLSARLTALPVREGGAFRRGQSLAVFEAPESRDALRSAASALHAARTRLDDARHQEARMDSLHASGAAALRELELARTELRVAEANVATTVAARGALRAGTILTAPFDGVVARRHVDPGATVGAGQPILDIRSRTADEIQVSVPESQMEPLTRGGAALQAQVGDGLWRAAEVVRVDGMVDYATRTRTAYVRLRPSPDAAGVAILTPGAYARVRLADRASVGRAAAAASSAVLVVPSPSLVRRGSLSGVYVVREGRARLRWLRVGRESGGSVEVLSGLDPGELVALETDSLVDGRRVEVGR